MAREERIKTGDNVIYLLPLGEGSVSGTSLYASSIPLLELVTPLLVSVTTTYCQGKDNPSAAESEEIGSQGKRKEVD